jgi:hypothetical protein
MSAAVTPRAFRLSLRELLLLFTAIFIGCAALKYANERWAAGAMSASILGFLIATILALVDRGSKQAFAIGFAVVVATYMGLLFAMGEFSGSPGMNHPEFHPNEGQLPTTLALRPVYAAVVQDVYAETATGKRLVASQLPKDAVVDEQASTGFTTAPYYFAGVRPLPGHFMTVGHKLWALLLAYVGGHFARFVYARRARDGAIS